MMPWSASNWMGSLMGIVIWLLIIVGAVFIVRWAMSSSRKGLAEHRPDVGEGGDEDPLNILRKRYARGEIDRETFERMKRELES
jgi:putative membrane protein